MLQLLLTSFQIYAVAIIFVTVIALIILCSLVLSSGRVRIHFRKGKKRRKLEREKRRALPLYDKQIEAIFQYYERYVLDDPRIIQLHIVRVQRSPNSLDIYVPLYHHPHGTVPYALDSLYRVREETQEPEALSSTADRVNDVYHALRTVNQPVTGAKEASPSKLKGKVVILTALNVEYQAVRGHLKNIRQETYKGTVYECGDFVEGQWSWEVGIAEIGVGNIRVAIEAERAIAYFAPELLLFVGVAGGIKDVNIGDVVVATKVYGYESAQLKNGAIFPRPGVVESSHRLVQRAQAERRNNEWLQRVQYCDRSLNPQPRVWIGAIAAGEKVVADIRSDVCQLLYQYYSDALAIEMEGRGLLLAAHGNEQVQALVIRGISDLIENKSDADEHGSQELASCYASAFAFEILAKLDVT